VKSPSDFKIECTPNKAKKLLGQITPIISAMKKSSPYTNSIRRFLLIIVFMISGILAAVAQTVDVEPMQHKLKVYKDVETQQLFWPKDLPVFVWLSTSPQQTAPKHKLETASLKQQDSTKSLEQSQINLELSGNQYLRWINYETKDTLLLEFQADGLPPSSSIMLSGAKTHQLEGKIYKGRGLKAEFDAIDEHAGVENIYVSVNGADFTPSFGVYDFNQEKEYSIAFYALDHVGNAEEVKKELFFVDLSAPVTQHQIVGVHQGSILAPSAEITLSSNDAFSGVAATAFHFNQHEQTRYEKAISVSLLDEGAHTLYYNSRDNVNNEETENVFQFYVDRTSPQTTLIIEGDQHVGDKTYVSNRTEYRLSFSDNKTGVSSTHFQINDNPVRTYEHSAISLPSEGGNYQLAFWSVDNVNNEEEKKLHDLFVDQSAPISTHSFNGSSFTQRGKTWITSQTAIELTANDDEAGVKEIQYSVEGEANNQLYTDVLSFSNEGELAISYGAVDKVNNVEEKQRVEIVVDNSPPVVTVNYSSSKIGSGNAEDGSVLDQYPVGTVLYLAATDEASGAESIRFSLNNEATKPFAMPLNFETPGEQKIEISATDRVGNEAIKTLRFIISE
jgi:hypothetical protein